MVVEVITHKPLYVNLAPFDTKGGEPAKRDMIQNYSVLGPRLFVLRPPKGITYQLHHLRLVVSTRNSEGAGDFQSYGYGKSNTALSANIRFDFIESRPQGEPAPPNFQKFLNMGGKIANNGVVLHWDWAHMGFEAMEDFTLRLGSAPEPMMVFRSQVDSVLGCPVILRGNRGGQMVVRTGTNNFAGPPRHLVVHRVIASGIQHSDLVTGQQLGFQNPDTPGLGIPV